VEGLQFRGYGAGVIGEELVEPLLEGATRARTGGSQAFGLSAGGTGAPQQWLLESVLGIEEAGDAERPVRRTQDDKWMLNMAAARRFHAREGHLNVPRKHTELVPLDEAGRGAIGAVSDGVPVALGMFLANTRRRADKLTPERRTELDTLDMRW
jgi:hypothetical protein